jgi:flavin reductase (DIM6/NTAB) family NADH-FMN oxidoreductase RutF
MISGENMEKFREISPYDLENAMKLIGKDWMLVSAACEEKVNTMTASWGSMGVLWGKEVCTVFIRPQRYTHEFIEGGDRMTLTWFGEEMRDKLAFCGAKSGREVDKIAECGFTAVTDGDGAIYYSEATRVMKLKKLYAEEIKPEYSLDSELFEFHYPSKDYHTMYICEILEILENVTEESLSE